MQNKRPHQTPPFSLTNKQQIICRQQKNFICVIPEQHNFLFQCIVFQLACVQYLGKKRNGTPFLHSLLGMFRNAACIWCTSRRPRMPITRGGPDFPPLSLVVVQSISKWGIAGFFSEVGCHELISMNVTESDGRHKSRIASHLSAEKKVKELGSNRPSREMLTRPDACSISVSAGQH